MILVKSHGLHLFAVDFFPLEYECIDFVPSVNFSWTPVLSNWLFLKCVQV